MIRAIRTAIGREEASAILESAAPVSAGVERRLFYPFHWFLLRCSTRTLLGRSAVRVSCLVDGRTGLCATTDPFELVELRISGNDVLDTKLPELDGRRVAERYVAYIVRGRRKALVRPELELLDGALVYKPFWVVCCTEGGATPFHVLVDGVTGRFHPLPVPPRAVNSRASTSSLSV